MKNLLLAAAISFSVPVAAAEWAEIEMTEDNNFHTYIVSENFGTSNILGIYADTSNECSLFYRYVTIKDIENKEETFFSVETSLMLKVDDLDIHTIKAGSAGVHYALDSTIVSADFRTDLQFKSQANEGNWLYVKWKFTLPDWLYVKRNFKVTDYATTAKFNLKDFFQVTVNLQAACAEFIMIENVWGDE